MQELQDYVDERDEIIDKLQDMLEDYSPEFKEEIETMIANFISETEITYNDFQDRIAAEDRYNRRCEERAYLHDRL